MPRPGVFAAINNVTRLRAHDQVFDTFYCTPDPMPPSTPPMRWSVEEVGLWLQSVGLGEYTKSFADEEVTGDALLAFDDEALADLGIVSIGDRLRYKRGGSRRVKALQPLVPHPTRPLTTR